MQRRTRQQEAIWRAVRGAVRPLSPHELLERARREVASVSLATVYRAINRLLGEGRIAAVELPGEAARYELAETAGAHHHHFRCDVCGRVYDVEGCPGGMDELAPAGFSLRDHEITLFGTCGPCSRKAG